MSKSSLFEREQSATPGPNPQVTVVILENRGRLRLAQFSWLIAQRNQRRYAPASQASTGEANPQVVLIVFEE